MGQQSEGCRVEPAFQRNRNFRPREVQHSHGEARGHEDRQVKSGQHQRQLGRRPNPDRNRSVCRQGLREPEAAELTLRMVAQLA